jgi:hypothetical protein
MKKVTINNRPSRIKLNSYRPLCMSEFGKLAVSEYSLSPFIDASCRREPDLENEFPSITSLCRGPKFGPTLKKDDIVVYISVKGPWERRLISILRVIEVRENHLSGSSFYKERGVKIPSNCMIEGNGPSDFFKTAGPKQFSKKSDFKKIMKLDPARREKIGIQIVKQWDSEYLERSKKWSKFVITETIYKNVENPPILTDEMMIEIMGRVPNTRTANNLSFDSLEKIGEIAGIEIVPNFDKK